MTTNQTIDGVPRDLLERCARELSIGIGPAPKNRAQELRALLDAPVGFSTPDCPDCACVQDGQCLCIPSKPAAQPQGEPVALLSKGFTTLETRDGKYRIITQYKNRDDAWSDYTALCKAEQPAPVAVVLPERLQQVLKFLDGSENLDGHWFSEPHPSGRSYWWRTELRKALEETNLFANQQ
ncbi:hypothetical protein [Pseudomonas veronii]